MADRLFDSEQIGIPCPKCGYETKKTIAWLRENSEFVCANCGTEIALERDQAVRTLDDVAKRISDVVGKWPGKRR